MIKKKKKKLSCNTHSASGMRWAERGAEFMGRGWQCRSESGCSVRGGGNTVLSVTGKKTNRLHEVLHNETPHVSREHVERKKPKRACSSAEVCFFINPNSLSARVKPCSKNSKSFHCRKAVRRPVMSLHTRAELNVSVVLHTDTT